MKEITLPRTGQRPLRFVGELIAEAGSQWHAGRECNRWHELAVYRTAEKYVVHIAYRTLWQGELGYDVAEVLDSSEDVSLALERYDPCARVAGYPMGDSYAERQQRLLTDIRSRYEDSVSEVLSGAEFAEEV